MRERIIAAIVANLKEQSDANGSWFQKGTGLDVTRVVYDGDFDIDKLADAVIKSIHAGP